MSYLPFREFDLGYRLTSAFAPLIALLSWVLVGSAWAGLVIVGEGSTLDIGDGVLSLGCGDLAVTGRTDGEVMAAGDIHVLPGGMLGPGSRSLSRDWSNAGAAAVPGAVHWRDDCGTNEVWILGNTEFLLLDISTTSGRTFRFDATGMQHVEQSLQLTGTSGAPLTLRSTAAGQRAGLTLAAGGTQSIVHVDVADLDASGGQTLAPGLPQLHASFDSGNNLNWFRGALDVMPVPALSGSGIALLILFLLIAVLRSGLVGAESNRD